ncbi:MAG: hypothetical protein ACFFBP_12135 [Promethearchaeota archaeon]
MDRQRILREAQKIASKFSFWMVSGNIAHLFGYVYETPDVKYELEIKFDDDFPNSPPQLKFYDQIKDLLGDFNLEKVKNWTPDSSVVDIMHELKAKIQEALQEPIIIEELIPIVESKPTTQIKINPNEEYITPDLNAYPSDFSNEDYITPSNVYSDTTDTSESSDSKSQHAYIASTDTPISQSEDSFQETSFSESEEPSLLVKTELGLIQQSYAYDQRGPKRAELNIYMTITITKTFIIGINFSDYPERPILTLPDDVETILGDPYQQLITLKKWNIKKPSHIVDILHELETKLFFIKDIEQEVKKILGEYQCDMVPNSVAQLKVHLLTYGFKEYILNIDLSPFPKPPIFNLSEELRNLIQIPIDSLNSYKNWKEKESEPIEIIREISWLVDKNSRINFELSLLQDHYKEIKYNSNTSTLRIDMKGKMQTQDMTFQFEINLPREYPLKLPEIKVINEFEIESHEKIKGDLQESFKSFFDEWTPFKYLVDLFDTISKKIFELSVVSCVICHKIECPSCNNKIGGSSSCQTECPYCERAYHKHCWDQTIASFGKCGFCLKTPPPNMIS